MRLSAHFSFRGFASNRRSMSPVRWQLPASVYNCANTGPVAVANCDLMAYSPWSCLEGRWRLRRFADVREPRSDRLAGLLAVMVII